MFQVEAEQCSDIDMAAVLDIAVRKMWSTLPKSSSSQSPRHNTFLSERLRSLPLHMHIRGASTGVEMTLASKSEHCARRL